jgi:hypothetical protein
MSYVADDHEAIRRRLEEIRADRQLVLTGSTIEDAKPTEAPAEIDWTKWNTGGCGDYGA